MKKILSVAVFVLFTVTLAGCGGGSSAVDDPHHEDYVPELRVFDIIDTNDTDTAKPNHPHLEINPYRNDGIFGVFWEVNSLEDYTVTLHINDQPTLANSLKVHSQVCGAGRSCDQDGGWACTYTTDFYMYCDNSNFEQDVYPLLANSPQKVYLLLKVCDSNSGYCEFDYYPVFLKHE